MAEEMSHSSPPILKSYANLQEILLDNDLAALGDAYVNFVYSLAMSQKRGHPVGAKVNNSVLAQAVGLSGLRELLPHRLDKHARGNAAEALLVFAWLSDIQELGDCTKVLSTEENLTQAFAALLRDDLERLENHGRKRKQKTPC